MAGSLEMTVWGLAVALVAAIVAFFIQQQRHARETTALREEMAALRKEAEMLGEKGARLQKHYMHALDRVQTMQKEIAERQKELTALHKEVTTLREETTALGNAGDSLRAENAALREKNSDLQTLLDAAGSQVEEAKREIAERDVSARQTHVDRRWRSWLMFRCRRREAASDAARAHRCGWPCAWAAE